MDASICAKWFLEEEYSDRARFLRDSFVRERLGIAVPNLIFYETLSVLRYSGAYDERELGLAALSLSKYGFEVWEPKGEIYNSTAHLSVRHDISVYDASYIALASHLHLPFYTVDRRLLEEFPRISRHLKNFSEFFGVDKGTEEDRVEDHS